MFGADIGIAHAVVARGEQTTGVSAPSAGANILMNYMQLSVGSPAAAIIYVL